MQKAILKKIIGGLLYGSTMFVGALLFIDICLSNSLSVLPHQYARNACGAICVGVGILLSSLIYDEDRLPFAARIIFHAVICIGVVAAAYVISGGIPRGTGFGIGTIFFLVEILFGLLIWLANLIIFLHEAGAIKKRINELNQGDEITDKTIIDEP